MNIFKTKILPIALIFVLAVTMMPFSPFLDKAYAEQLEEDILGRSKGEVYIWDLPWFMQYVEAVDLDDEYLSTVDEAGAVLRKQMVERNSTPTFKYILPADATNSEISKTIEDIFYEATEHTGKPKEGDSLYYGWQQWYASVRRTTDSKGQYLTVIYNIKYYTTAAQEATLDRAVANLKTNLNIGSKSDYQKVKTIYDYICKNVSYDWNHTNDSSYTLQFTPYAALVNKTAVCQGYSTLFYRLTLEYGIDTRVITGTSEGVGHAWNIVKLNGQYFYLDSTWDAGNSKYSYFLKGSKNWKNHTPYSMFETSSFKSKYNVSKSDYDPNQFEALKVTVSNVSSTGKIKLSWDAKSNASGYEIYRSSGNDSNYKKYTTRSASSTSYTDTGAKAGVTYYYKIRAIFDGTTAKSGWGYASLTCDLAKPDLKLSNVSSTGKIKLSWGAVDGATGYEIYRSSGNDKNYKKYTTSTASSTSYTDSRAKAGITYYYKIRAIYSGKSAANSAWDYENLTCDLAKPDLKLSNVSSTGKIKLSWGAVDGATGYEIYRSSGNDDNYKKYTTSTASSTSYTDSRAQAGITYYYRIRAIYSGKSAANSAWDYENLTCDLARPKITISATKKPGKLYLKWDKVDKASSYIIYRSTSKDGTYKKYSTTTGTTYTNVSVTKGKTYYYKVVAAYKGKSAANSAYSNVAYARVR